MEDQEQDHGPIIGSVELLCYICKEPLHSPELHCQTCRLPICRRHRSEDYLSCTSCYNPMKIHDDIKDEPLIGPDEVRHKGRQIVLTGEAWMRRKVIISEMTDDELREELKIFQAAVREAEVILDYRRIIKNQVENSLELRTTKFSRLQLLRMTNEANERAKLNGEASPLHAKRSISVGEGNDLKSAMGALSKLGLSKEKLILLIQKLAQNKENK
jgi:hypothetical protein